MSNKTDLDWLALNVHAWPSGDHQPWCYVYMAHGGVMKAAGNFLDAVAKPTMITIDQWLSRRAELQNKPSWDDAPEWAVCIVQDRLGNWYFCSDTPNNDGGEWSDEYVRKSLIANGGVVLGDWRDTLEKRPEQNEFEPFVSIEDSQEKEMKQDNKWFERGELPPIGEVCEAYIDYPPLWIETEIVAHKDGFAIGWCNSVMKGCHGDKAHEFRPLRTEREKAIDEMVCEFIDHHGDPKGGERYLGIAAKLYDAGYRKGVK